MLSYFPVPSFGHASQAFPTSTGSLKALMEDICLRGTLQVQGTYLLVFRPVRYQ